MGALRRGISFAAIAIVGGVLAPGTSAQAATVTVGSPLTANFTGALTSHSLEVNTALPEPGATVASPVDGTIINWRAILGSTGEMSLLVVKPASGGAYTPGLGMSSVHTNSVGLQTFPSGLVVKAGDLIGLDLEGTTIKEASPTPGATISEWALPFDFGSSRPPDNTHNNSELAYNATVEYCLVPKLKGKKLGAAKKALANGGCRVGDVTRPKKGKAAKFVKSQSVPPGTALADQAVVNLKLRRKPKKK